MKVTRFNAGLHDPRDNGTPEAVMIEKPQGAYVRYEDAAALLKKYGRHESTCAAYLFTPKPCNCGWDGVQ